MMRACFAIHHSIDEKLLQRSEHDILQAIADEVRIRFEPGFAGDSYLEVPADENVKRTVQERLEQHCIAFNVVTCIAY